MVECQDMALVATWNQDLTAAPVQLNVLCLMWPHKQYNCRLFCLLTAASCRFGDITKLQAEGVQALDTSPTFLSMRSAYFKSSPSAPPRWPMCSESHMILILDLLTSTIWPRRRSASSRAASSCSFCRSASFSCSFASACSAAPYETPQCHRTRQTRGNAQKRFALSCTMSAWQASVIPASFQRAGRISCCYYLLLQLRLLGCQLRALRAYRLCVRAQPCHLLQRRKDPPDFLPACSTAAVCTL